MAKNNRKVKLLIVRHGEREDEAIDYGYWDQQEAKWDVLRSSKPRSYAKMDLATAVKQKVVKLDQYPAVDTLDPLLTPEGHQQAKASFLAIASALPRDSKVAVFSSPLRRAIGTSLMLGSVPWDESIDWSGPAHAAAAGRSSKHSNEGSHRGSHQTKTIPVTVLNGLGDFASRVHLRGGVRILSQNGLLRCSSTLSGNDGSCESPFVRTLAGMPSHEHEHGNVLERTNDVRFWTPEGQSLTGTIDPHAKQYRGETASDKLLEIQKQEGFFAKMKRRARQAKKRGSILSSQLPPDPLGAIDEAIRMTLARGCDTCLIVAHREAIRDLKQVCNHRFSIALPYCCIGSFGAVTTTKGGRNDRVRYNFWSVVPLENFDAKSIPRCLSRNAGLVNVMWTLGNGEVMCLCRLDIRGWGCSLPPEVWPKTTHRNSMKLADLTDLAEAGVVSTSDHNRLPQNFVQPVAQNGRFLYFDSTVWWHHGNASSPHTFRFCLSTETLQGSRVILWYKAL